MRVLVCGGATFNNSKVVDRILTRIHFRLLIDRIIHGGSPGADSLADAWADAHCVWTVEYALAPKETPRRLNDRMLLEQRPDAVIAFPGGPVTRDMVAKARKVTAVVEVDARGAARVGRHRTPEHFTTSRHVCAAARTLLPEERRK